jgi:hypothetical protein
VLPALSHRDIPLPQPQLIVAELAELIGVEARAAAALHVRGTNRWLYALMKPDGGGIVVKAGKAGDERLEREASMLEALASHETALQLPVLRWHGERDGWFALVTDIVERLTDARSAGIEDARFAACSLATMDGGFVVHGDLAPWNMVPSPNGLALVDWEKSRFEFDPLCDLAHYVIRTGALLHMWRPRAAVNHLVGRESVGRQYLQDIGVDPDSAAEHLLRYLRRPTLRSAGSSNIRRYELEMLQILSLNPA